MQAPTVLIESLADVEFREHDKCLQSQTCDLCWFGRVSFKDTLLSVPIKAFVSVTSSSWYMNQVSNSPRHSIKRQVSCWVSGWSFLNTLCRSEYICVSSRKSVTLLGGNNIVLRCDVVDMYYGLPKVQFLTVQVKHRCAFTQKVRFT